MQSGNTRFWTWVATGVIGLVIGVLVNVVFSDVRVSYDLTEDQRYTLPPAAVRIAQALDDDFTITVYLSEALPSYLSHFRRALQVRLEEFAHASGGKLKWAFVDPDTEKDLEEGLKKFVPPITRVPLQDFFQGKPVTGTYFTSMHFRHGDQETSFNIVELLRQAVLQEAEVMKLIPFQIAAKIVKLRNPEKKFGLVSEKKMADPRLRNPQQQNQEATDGLDAFRAMIERHLPKPQDVVLKGGMPVPELDTLVIHRPDDLDERTVYEIDQFLMKGKKVVLLLDNYSLFDIDRVQDFVSSFLDPMRSGGDASNLKVREIKHGLKDWLAHYGVIVNDGYLEDASCGKAMNRRMALTPAANGQFRMTPVDNYVVLPGFVVASERGDDKKPTGQFSESSPALAGLGQFCMAVAVPMALDPDAVARHGKDENGKARASAEELVRTTRKCWVKQPESGAIKIFHPVQEVPLAPEAEWGSHPLAVSVHGRFKSFFAGKKFGTSDRPPRKGPDGKPLDEAPGAPATIEESAGPGQLWVFADSDFISDYSFGTQVFQAPIAGALGAQNAAQALQYAMVGLVNILDSMTVGDELVEIRRPQLVDRTLDATKIDSERTSINLRSLGLPILLIIGAGFVRWLLRWLGTRIKSPMTKRPTALG